MDNDTVIRLRRVVLKLARQLNAASREEGLTPTQASVLGIATMRGPPRLADGSCCCPARPVVTVVIPPGPGLAKYSDELCARASPRGQPSESHAGPGIH